MRDPARIDRICDLLRAYWHAHPDLRLGQIVGNFTPRRIDAMARHYPEAVFPEKQPSEPWPLTETGLTLASASLARHLARTWAEAMRRDLAAPPRPGAAQGTP
jgi:hypothetical protein